MSFEEDVNPLTNIRPIHYANSRKGFAHSFTSTTIIVPTEYPHTLDEAKKIVKEAKVPDMKRLLNEYERHELLEDLLEIVHNESDDYVGEAKEQIKNKLGLFVPDISTPENLKIDDEMDKVIKNEINGLITELRDENRILFDFSLIKRIISQVVLEKLDTLQFNYRPIASTTEAERISIFNDVLEMKRIHKAHAYCFYNSTIGALVISETAKKDPRTFIIKAYDFEKKKPRYEYFNPIGA
jgi:hypothetical protein